ncbi:hypothetical protein B0H11DRAFT_2078923 [Mycena galericulata]|nr:hypothetical protein B0H11DRAFT_2078923 [Mycena galericulata]
MVSMHWGHRGTRCTITLSGTYALCLLTVSPPLSSVSSLLSFPYMPLTLTQIVYTGLLGTGDWSENLVGSVYVVESSLIRFL